MLSDNLSTCWLRWGCGIICELWADQRRKEPEPTARRASLPAAAVGGLVAVAGISPPQHCYHCHPSLCRPPSPVGHQHGGEVTMVMGEIVAIDTRRTQNCGADRGPLGGGGCGLQHNCPLGNAGCGQFPRFLHPLEGTPSSRS